MAVAGTGDGEHATDSNITDGSPRSCTSQIIFTGSTIPPGTTISLRDPRTTSLSFQVLSNVNPSRTHSMDVVLATATGQNCYRAPTASFVAEACQNAGAGVSIALDRTGTECSPPFTITTISVSLTEVNLRMSFPITFNIVP